MKLVTSCVIPSCLTYLSREIFLKKSTLRAHSFYENCLFNGVDQLKFDYHLDPLM